MQLVTNIKFPTPKKPDFKGFGIGFLLFAVAVTALFGGYHAITGILSKVDGNFARLAMEYTMPALSASREKEALTFSDMCTAFIGFDITDPKSILGSQVLAFNPSEDVNLSSSTQAEKPSEIPPQPSPSGETGVILETTISPASSSGYLEAAGVLIRNSTTYTVDPVALYNEPLKYDGTKSGPKVLITHAHTSESYKSDDSGTYNTADPDRSRDNSKNVVRVGDEIVNELKNAGIEAIHDTKLHDYPNYNTSYKDCLASTQEYLNKYPSIQIVLDIHRDAISRGSNTQVKTVADLSGQKVAQIMIVCGTDQGGLSHPNWRDNLAFAIKYQEQISKLAPTICRPMDFRKERFNMHTTPNSLILEMGSSGNSLDEAVRSGRVAGKALVNLLE